MTSRILRSIRDVDEFANLLRHRKLPVSVTVVPGKARTTEQNKLQRLWCKEIAEQLGDQSAEEIRGFCKLTMGVPILRAENDAFCDAYDRVIRPMPYEAKLACMMEPLDFSVTRLMTVWQTVRFLDHMHRHFAEMGLALTEPDPQFAADLKRANARASAALVKERAA